MATSQHPAAERRGRGSAAQVAEPPPLLEREHELEALESVVAAAVGGAGQMVVIEASPGVGKTRLLAETRANARHSDVLVLDGRGAELEREFAFGVARQLLEPAIFGFDEDERSRLFDGAARLAARLFDPNPDDATGIDASFATFHGLYWLVVNLADRAPLLICVDDAHWADAQTLRFLDYLVHRIEGLAVSMVLAGRAPDTGGDDGLWGELAAQPTAIAVLPQPLSEEGVRTLVRDRLGPQAADEFCAACHVATRGNPLFLRELLAALRAGGVTPSADAAGEVTSVGSAAVSRFVLHRLAALGPEAVELARAVAVLGDPTDVPTAARVAGLTDDACRNVADLLVRADVLAPSEQLAFVHPVVRAAIYEDLAPGERQLRHAAAADLLAGTGAAAERVAAHLLLTAPGGDAWRARTLRAAGQSAAARGVPETAAVYLRRALDEPPPDDERGEVLSELGSCELAAMQFSAAEAHLQAAVATSADAAVRARAASQLGFCSLLSGGRSVEAAVSTMDAVAADLGSEHREVSLDLESDLLVLTTSVPRLRVGRSERRARFGRAAAGEPQYEAVAQIHSALESLTRGERADAAVEQTQAALAVGLPAAQMRTTLFIALATFIRGERHDIAGALVDAGLEVARQQGHTARQGVLHGQRASLALARGALVDAQLEAESGLALVDERHFAAVQLAAVAVVVHIERGDLEAAAAAAERGGVFGVTEDRIYLDEYLTSRGRLRIAQGRVDEGLADLLWCGERLQALGVRWPCSWRAFASQGLAAQGETERAVELAQDQIELTRSVGAPCELGRALRTGGIAIGGRHGLELLEEAVAVLERTPARLELAHAMTDLGAELCRQQRRREGREALRLGMQIAVECGALALAERARAELTAGGGRRPRLELTGVNALTPAERRVCEMAADGDLTNRAIAQHLFVTEKTVELHLSSAYRKLGIRSRFQLAAALSP
jgi:DNA-binding CsgD family transcriptional regulator/tetratricopeptide (TPR) repeat protein